jgi:hypothetical protein
MQSISINAPRGSSETSTVVLAGYSLSPKEFLKGVIHDGKIIEVF